MSGNIPLAAAAKVLCKELRALKKEPVEGFRIVQVDEADLYEWIVAIYGPFSTVYEGGCFRAIIRFGGDYPFTPPTFRFLTRIWHPNIYENGEVCISILHPPSNTTQGGELPEERWNPAQSVRTVVMSIISMLNEPNTFSPANVDASIMYRDYKSGKSKRYSAFKTCGIWEILVFQQKMSQTYQVSANKAKRGGEVLRSFQGAFFGGFFRGRFFEGFLGVFFSGDFERCW